MTHTQTHTAWRCIGSLTMYVASINYHNAGDPYSYTSKVEDALPLSENQCRAFCNYMKQCADVGFWC